MNKFHGSSFNIKTLKQLGVLDYIACASGLFAVPHLYAKQNREASWRKENHAENRKDERKAKAM